MFPASNGTPRLLLILLHAGCLLLSLPLNASRYVAAAWSPVSFSYNFTDPSSYDQRELRFEGDAAVNGGLVDLTCSSLEVATTRGCTGRLSYGRHVLLYDDTTGSVGSFATRFTFNIKLLPGHPRGDGMAFFLVGYPSEMPADSAGGALGLTNVKDNTALGPSRFVAVEFDTYNNSFEPQETMDHIGIHLSSIKDSHNTTSLTDFTLNGTMTASINFDGSTRMLVARLHFDDRPSMPPVEVSERLPHPETLLPPEVAVGFSASTTGESGVELHQILSWSFDSARPKETKSIGTGLIAGAIAGGACVFLVVVWFILSWFRWKRRRNSLMVSGAGPREFLYRDLVHATNNFSSERKLGKGAFGAVYRGTSLKVDKDGEERQVAVKELLKGSGLGGTKDFLTEVNTISKTKHKNLVKLEGWCSYSRSAWSLMFWCCCNRNQLDDHKLFLVYELMPKGDLDHHLHDKDVAVLPWPARYKIVKGVGSALVYLHHDCVPYILHRDIKPGNILLDDDYNAKLADFGLSRIANKKNTIVVDRCRLSWIANKSMSTVVITTAVGTGAYMDPKFKVDGDVTFDRSSDVYSFGLVLLEIACGRRNSRKEVWDLYERSAPKLKVEVVADERLGGDFDMEQMQRVLVVGLWCSLPDSAERPSMREAMRLLERDELPHLTSSPTSPLHEGSNETARTRRGTYSEGSRRLLYGSRRVLSL